MVNRESEHDKFMKDIHRIDIILRNHKIATVIECKRPDFDSSNPNYAEVKFHALNPKILEMLIQFINEEAQKFGSEVAARIIETKDENETYENLMVLVPYKGTPKERWFEGTYKYLHHFTRAVKDYEQRYKKPA
jgi:hypothetical protein